VNKLQQAGLKSYSSKIVKPPRVKEAKAWIECRFLEDRRIGDHMAVLGEVLTAEVRDEVVENEEINFLKVNSILHVWKDTFASDFKIIKQKRYEKW
jgi:flavin reductase (DIM6/NTAB) family NADH-FMN oxidoreductase RutF